MTREAWCQKREEAIAAFAFCGEAVSCTLYGSGHINDTFLLQVQEKDGIRPYILQRVNHLIYRDPAAVLENIARVTEFLQKKVAAAGGDPRREVMNLIPLKTGGFLFRDSIGAYWRAYQFVSDSICLDRAETPQDFYESAVAFGTFQRLLADYPAETLEETIADFHNTPKRFRDFCRAVKSDPLGRAAQAEPEIRFLMEREAFTHVLLDAYNKGMLPLRVVHNDTKLNNVMFDRQTRRAVCVIDLDTIMPGFSVTDFGDSIRFGAATAAEDEPDLSLMHFDFSMYQCYTEGFLKGCGGTLTKSECALLPEGAKMMTLECGMRFLADYLEGDSYFRIAREHQNLDRCRTQLKLVAEMEAQWDNMKAFAIACGDRC
ncbi:phosphotransferase enzyme family protein [Yeguia hominis]|uniref:Aminoglycoside phosphotransferase family protein n=1 Tax=Yeguia hominis TaxID=2763662 RepID=A0A926D5Y0_9FIRM|nr:aminoglycoside phosphotransferase family protein [Yeguia hominis]MBC8533020.1 aminoglycoside phosphotransferase family protein [Yeguia hominis]